MTAIDAVTLEVVRNAIFSVAEEMRVIVMRSARSPLLKEAGDLSCVLTDARGRLIAQGNLDNPIHLGVMCFTVKEFLKRFPPETLRDGDVFYTNAPTVGGNHLPDVKAIKPIFWEGELVAFSVNLSHWPDVGGALPGSYVPWATDLTQEGLHITPVRLFDADGPVRETLDLILANVRGRVEREGDIHAQRAAAEVAARRLHEIFAQFGTPTVLSCFERMMNESGQLMRAALTEVPDGVYVGEDWMDDDGIVDQPIRIRVRVTIAGDTATFDFDATDPQARGPINTTYFIACSSVYYVCKALLGPDIPANDGLYRALTVNVPEGTLLNPAPHAPIVGGNHETSQRVADALFVAFAQAIPERVQAGGITTSGLAVVTGRWPNGTPFTLYEVHGGGEGGSLHRDGLSALRVHMANTMNTPVEVIEHEYPLFVEESALRDGSAGAGRQRGGLGIRRLYRIANAEARLTTMIERCIVPPYGLLGGAPGEPSRVSLDRDGEQRTIKGKESVVLQHGDLVTVETAGGGGYGPPVERSAELAQRDLREGYG